MADIQCVNCTTSACTADGLAKTPIFCPRRLAKEALEEADRIRQADGEVRKCLDAARWVEEEGYRKWPRAKELVEFSKRMGFRKLGIAFCTGLREETGVLTKVLESHGFHVSSVACTVQGGCNPVGQALALNHAQTELNVIMGLCMGHDVLFTKFSEAPVTTLVVKDRVTCHNPVAPLVCAYWRKSLFATEATPERT